MADDLDKSDDKAVSRRDFLGAAAATGALAAAGSAPATAAATEPTQPGTLQIYKAVKWGMIGAGESVRDKFALCRELGYDGMELVSPGAPPAAEIRAASEATGMPVHGLVNMKHWEVRMSSPDPAVRDEAHEIMLQAIRDAAAFGGSSVLLVPGRVAGADETHDDVWQRSIVEIRRVLPLAAKLGVRVLIENVWNGFCETAEQFRDYLDEIDSPWVGAYFDIGNAWKFAPSQNWIRTLGSRIVKLDVKGWGAASGFGKIGDGDIQWAEVRAALAEIGFTGWATAEVAGGGEARLADISARMDRVLDLHK